ncbi:uncharacterized protein LOC107272211 isoform X2 [Cephus cinctus]|uniref:Uncharacterized protein LOC107272211 isoform X2 n=1 Tax=Cephus cinctus TaxID=211228 RepID=A0AAJ7RQM7_CEPCN|nr:uncharacterized protein LOC107272211 isoform X2 [Cephus cinctus]
MKIIITMPNLMERRKIKKQLMSAGQSPVYNIYYTDSVPIQQVPNFTRNLAKSFPQVNKASSLRTRRQPKTNGFFRRTRHFARDKSYYFDVPFFPGEEQRQRMEQYTMSQSKPPTVEIYKNYEQPICPEQLNYLNYQRNQYANDYLLPNYGYHYKKSCHAANMLELTKSYQQMLSTEQTRSFDNCATSIDLNTKRNEISVSTVDTSNQLITVPTQPVNSGNDNSMNIEVHPLRHEEIGEENANKTINEKSEQSLDGNDTIREFLKEEVGGPCCEIGDRVVNGELIGGDVLTKTCSFFNKKRMSLLRKLSARIRKNKAKPVAKVSRLPQTSTCPVSELAKFKNIQSTDLLTFKIQSDNSNWLNAQSNQVTLRKLSNGTEVIVSSMDDDVRSFAYSAQEILSPRQMISSMTNVYAEQRDAENHLRMSERKCEYQKTPNNVKSNSSIGSNFQTEKFISFQDIEEKVENRITRYEPNFMSPPYHEQGPFWLQHPQYRQRYGYKRHCEQENLRVRHHHYHRDLRRQFSAFDDGNVDDPTSHLEFSPPLVLRSLAKAANIILTSIFGRTTVPMSNRTQQRQQYRQSNHHDSIITIRDRRVNREGMCCRRNSENFKEARKTQDPQRH